MSSILSGQAGTTGSASDLLTGTLPIARIADGSLTAAKLAASGVTPGTATFSTVTVNAQGIVTAVSPGMVTSAFAFAGSGENGVLSPGSGSTTTLAANMAYSTVIVPAGGCTIKTSGFLVFTHVLDVSAGGSIVFSHDGDPGVGTARGVGYANVGFFHTYSGNGANANFVAGVAGSVPAGGEWPFNGQPGRGGAGGASSDVTAGGVAQAANPTVAPVTDGCLIDFNHFINAQISYATPTFVCGGIGGSSGGGVNTGAKAAGGAGGAGGGYCAVVVGAISGDPSLITVRANGGAGAAGASNAGLGGGGGGGGGG